MRRGGCARRDVGLLWHHRQTSKAPFGRIAATRGVACGFAGTAESWPGPALCGGSG